VKALIELTRARTAVISSPRGESSDQD